ncbi:MAG: RnfABCDGE type electron transport complex subunit D [Treponema sp.]
MITINAHHTVPGPFIYTSMQKDHRAYSIMLLLILHTAMMVFLQDFAALLVIAVSGAAAFSASAVIGVSEKKYAFDIHAVLMGLLTGFFLPVHAGFFFAFVITFLTYCLTWGAFGGKGTSWLHPVMLAVCIAYISKPDYFIPPVSFDQMNSAGGLFPALNAAGISRWTFDQPITSLLNSKILHPLGVTLPEGYMSLFFSYPADIAALRYNGITLIASIILLSLRAIEKTVPFVFLTVYGLLVYVFAQFPVSGELGGGDILAAWLTSGAFFTAFFVLYNAGSLPRSQGGRILSGVIMGVAAFFISGPSMNPAGIPFAVVLTNCITPLIEQLESAFYRKRRSRL